jgi:poly-gamma-glutamate synthesis protein (capsule biosynthesis protein)
MSMSRANRAQRHRKKSKKPIWLGLAVLLITAAVLLLWGIEAIRGTGRPPVTEAGETTPPVVQTELPASKPPTSVAPSVEPSPSLDPAAASTAPTGTPEQPSAEPTATTSPVAGTPSDAGPNATPASGNASVVIPYPEGVFTDPSRIQMAFTGDIMLGSNVDGLLQRNGYDYPYRELSDYLKRPDLTIANLETPITTRGTAQFKEYVYRSSPLVLPAFREAGFDLVNLANNHSMDYGVEGLLDTFTHLTKEGIPYVGAGNNAAEAFRPVILEKKGIRIAFLGFSRVIPEQSWKAGANSPGLADTYNHTVPVEAIRKASAEADLVVVIAHWGVERNDLPEAYQRDLAKRYIDAGADLIVGSHPHVLQGFENYKGKWIAYSLGNFIFTTNAVVKTWDSMVLEASCSIDGDCALNAVPVLTKAAQPKLMLPDAAAQLFKRLSTASFGAKLQDDGQIVRVNP